MIKEFKKFINRGSVVDLAVGVMIGGAFSKIISSIVDDLVMPFVGVILGGLDFSSLVIKIGEAEIKYGILIQNIVNFFLIAIFLFMIVKLINKANKKDEAKPKETKVTKPEDILLLEEIRDLLKKKK